MQQDQNHFPWQIVLAVLQGLVLLGYPLAVYAGLSHFGTRGVGLLVLVMLLPGILRTVAQRRAQLKGTLGLPVAIAALMLTAMVTDDERFILAYPALVNAVLLAQFAATLRAGSLPMVERFARLQVDDLSAAELVYCRRVTQFWIGFFVVNGGACAGLAAFAPRAWWALYAGLLSYILLGLCFAVEFTLRKYLFRRFGSNPLDRFYRRIFGPQIGPDPQGS